MHYLKIPLNKISTFLEKQQSFVFLETNKYDVDNWRSYLFINPTKEFCLTDKNNIQEVFQEIELLTKTKYVAGYFSYELGYCFEERLSTLLPEEDIHDHLLQLGVFEEVLVFNHKNGTWEGDEDIIAEIENQDEYILSKKVSVSSIPHHHLHLLSYLTLETRISILQ